MTDTVAQQVAAEVRAEMARQHRTAVSLAPIVGLSTWQLSRRLSGEVPFDVQQLAHIAAALGKTAADFYREQV